MKLVTNKLRVERLEDRTVPAIFGVPWPDPGHLTLSFVPDGTAYSGGGTSTLFATMDALMPRDVWQQQIINAFQSWTAVAGINISVVSDGGDPLDETSSRQHPSLLPSGPDPESTTGTHRPSRRVDAVFSGRHLSLLSGYRS